MRDSCPQQTVTQLVYNPRYRGLAQGHRFRVSKGNRDMSKLKNYISAAAAGVMSVALAMPAAAAPVKFDFWFGLSGDLQRVVETLCKNFNDSQKDYEVSCVSQGSYDAALQNTIAAFRA